MSPTWTPNSSIAATYGGQGATNPYGVSGYYDSSDPNLNFIVNEWYLFSTLAQKLVAPIVSGRSMWCASNTVVQTTMALEIATGGGGQVGGFTMPCQAHVPGIAVAETSAITGNAPTATPTGATGTMIHEWGHCIDNQYVYTYGVVNSWPLSRSQQSDVQTIWTAVTNLSGYTNNGSVFYGWINIREFFAETFRFQIMGPHGLNITNAVFGNPVTKTPDQMFKGMIMGVANINAADDANTTAMRAIINTLAPPYPTAIAPLT